MNKTIADLLNPEFDHYRSVGELARTLQFLIATAETYRDPGRWGESGPHEALVNYGSCTNCLRNPWHSNRILMGQNRDVTTWQENHDALYRCILAALCNESDSHRRWRKNRRIGLRTLLKFPMSYQHDGDEKNAWEQLKSLHRHQLSISTLNSCHPRVNLLAAPELVIDGESIHITCQITQRSEMRQSPRCYSRWEVGFLLKCQNKDARIPKWNCRRETFAAFVLRAVAFYKSINVSVKLDRMR